ncbi:MAG: hypothetical protein F8N38_01100 [Hungatella sp.]|nr:hypothetical protein [Hungatella sp.]
MGYYKKCPCCGANLDPNEKCDCLDQENNQKREESNYDNNSRYQRIRACSGGYKQACSGIRS